MPELETPDPVEPIDVLEQSDDEIDNDKDLETDLELEPLDSGGNIGRK